MATVYPVPDPRLNLQPYATEESFDNEQEILRLLGRGGGVQQVPQQAPAAAPQAAVQRALPRTVESLSGRGGDLFARGMALVNQEPDTSALQEYARQRGEMGNAAMMNALAAQFAGEGFAPMQAHFLKKAAAAQDPMKLSGGILTAEGRFLKDPFAEQDKKANMLLQLARHYEQMAVTAETAQERESWNRQYQQAMLALREDSNRIQRQNAESRANDSSKTWRGEDNLRKDFDLVTKDLREELAATGKITTIMNATPEGQKPDAITQQSLVILLNKFLDPGSVVREGEFDRVVKAQGLEGRARNLADRIMKGEPLNVATIQQINGLAKLYQQAATQKIQGIANNYSSIAKKRGFDVESVISDPRYRGSNTVDFNSLPK